MPSLPSILSLGLVFSSIISTATATTYRLSDNYAGSTFLDGFDFFTDADPTHGFVSYVDRNTASTSNLLKLDGTDNYIGVDHTTALSVAGGVGRKSVRITSKKSFNKGLFVLDLKHMPGGICGTWPAFWSLGDGTWPQTGEIDIIEGVNQNTQNKFNLHTDTKCKTDGLNQTDSQAGYDCALDSASGTSGCDVNSVKSNTYGTGFNSANGGVYAMEWTSSSIKMWFFPRGQVPASISQDAPDTSKFGTPNANFQGACDIDARFKNHRFIFDTTFCGDWAGNVYGQTSCKQYSGLSSMDSCKKFVAENPSAFEQAYWQISYLKAYVATIPVSSSSARSTSTMSSLRASSSSAAIHTSSTSTARSTSSSPRQSSTLATSASSRVAAGSSTKASSSAIPSSTKKVTSNATCGEKNGFTCQGSSFGNCCSSAGWCGRTSAYCGSGCQKGFGTCT